MGHATKEPFSLSQKTIFCHPITKNESIHPRAESTVRKQLAGTLSIKQYVPERT